ncbi:antibiotic biosynthesis monooxygenase [Pararhodobacter marinus]|uniref:Antibiotic biosynthesis monooxygenase n=1 Tax=Pararhodobacter marinus TaxID=2184063 RepID=A0A2U2C5L6_9RHOB|nr:antibiotic biosynthesis monooxygenase [Pararhodobacter marinus]PWE27186.1 antibiotic biosynthesis monooxygenase [Pararhodobacter marinus]
MAITWILETTLDPGRADELRALAADMSASTRANEPGCTLYEWFISEDGTRCHILEGYADDEAVVTHVKNLNAQFARQLFGIVRPARFVVYGSPGEEARNAIHALQPVYMPPLMD